MKNNHGFTLAELIVVCVIIGILSFVVFSASKNMPNARATCVKEHNISYCAGQSGITEEEFRKLLDEDKEKSQPCVVTDN